jgi:hypothetical protein
MRPTPYLRLSRSSRSKLNAAFHAALVIAALGNHSLAAVLAAMSEQNGPLVDQISRHIF